MGLVDTLSLSYEELACYTNNFCESNYLGHFQFGKFYRGKIECAERTQYVLMKIWEVSKIYIYKRGDNELRLMDEVILPRHERVTNHPGMAKLYGYCFEGDHLGVVYDFKPFVSLFNLIPEAGFTWLQRIKVALEFASLLKFLHAVKCSSYKPFIVRNLDCTHLVLDEDYIPKLCDFGLITGGIFPDRTIYTGHHVLGSYGYIDCSTIFSGVFSDKQDVYAFGTIFLSLISKSVYTEEDRQNSAPCRVVWAWESFYADDDSETEVKKPKFSLVHQSLVAESDYDPADGHKITMLAMECTDNDVSVRPTMKQVVRSLLKLKVVKKNADFFGVNKVLRSCENGGFLTNYNSFQN
ncbi:hypothetical protein DH2020_021581 [Rehmannia glutinosa]|uniref:Protein kinase domain-containing protein n=1 Tax=Rehmannia glutinosa TaxID=99300 RepID=A0ABR0WDA5_REHGL